MTAGSPLVRWTHAHSPSITPPSTYPNFNKFAAFASVVNCTNTIFPTVFRIGWKVGSSAERGPCLTDPIFGGYHCVPGGLNHNLMAYKDADGNTMPLDTRYKNVMCPNSASRS